MGYPVASDIAYAMWVLINYQNYKTSYNHNLIGNQESKIDKHTLLPNCCMLRHRGFQIGFKLSFTTSVLHIGTEPPLSTILDILKKGS